MKRALAAAITLIAAIFVVAMARLAPPRPASDAPPATFSAARARVLQRELALAGPRPTGSEGNAKGRALLADALRKAGFHVEEQKGFACGRHGACAYLVNVVGTLPGREASAPPVLLMAHHDSVTCSPGASDDGVGAAAVVEAASAFAAGPRGKRPLLVVLTDGEEDGLLGAELFAKDHPPVFAAVNVDARGGRGPSAMFETSKDSAWLVDLAARRLERPVTSSLFFEVYKRMPNDTDFTVVKPFAPGLSLANIAGIEAYHTPQDDLDHADPGTLQHHGSQALALARALADAPADPPRGESVWFDVLALGIVRWPLGWSLPLALSALALVLGQAVRARAWGRGLVAAPLGLAAGAAIAFVLGWALLFPAPWIAHPLLPLLSLHLATIAAALAVVPRIGGAPRVQWAGAWLGWATLGVATAVVAPGASFLFTVPAPAAGLAGALPLGVACVIPAAVAAVLWAPIALTLPDAIGFAIPVACSASTALLATTIAPLLPRGGAAPRRAALAAFAAACLFAIASLVLPRFTREVPQRVNVIVADDGTRARTLVAASWGAAYWGKPPASMVGAGDPIELLVPWIAPGPVHASGTTGLPLPIVEHVEDAHLVGGSGRHVRANLRSLRGARTLVVELPRERRVELLVHGQRATPRWGNLVAIRAVPESGIDVELDADGTSAIDLTLYDTTPGVPEGAAPARPVNTTQTQDGDSTVTFARAKL